MKNGREIAERRYWERNKRKKINKKEKTTQQQKGPSTLSAATLSADLKNLPFDRQVDLCHDAHEHKRPVFATNV